MQPLIFLSLWAIYNSRFHKPWGKNDKAIITNVKLAITHPQNILCIAKLDNPICPFWTENKKKNFFYKYQFSKQSFALRPLIFISKDDQ